MRLPTPEDFTPWPKIPRLYRDITITEKIDGTNAAICIQSIFPFTGMDGDCCTVIRDGAEGEPVHFELTVQSRKRWLMPGKGTDNFGFAGWVEENKETLFDDLGPGLHFGEWYGSGIQRNYGLDHKRFALFNVRKARKQLQARGEWKTPNLEVVPVLYEGEFSAQEVHSATLQLDVEGSKAVPGFKPPEGIVVFFQAAGQPFKFTLDGDGHKG